MSEFSQVFAAEFKGYMAANGISARRLAAELGRNSGYVTERTNGLRALDTEDIDTLATLTGISGRELIYELAERTRRSMSLRDSGIPYIGKRITEEEAYELGAVANTGVIEVDDFEE